MSYFAKRIIPCLDVDNGRVVKGVNFVGLRDAGDPVEVAKRYNQEGADEITFLASTGLQTCKDFCASRKYTGENRCICIRERFPTSAHYDLYLRARSKYLELLEIGILAKAASQEATGEKNEK